MILRLAALLFFALVCFAEENEVTPLLQETLDVSVVHMAVTALDKAGKAVTDLRAEEVKIEEDGVRQSILDFTAATGEISIVGNIAFLLDNSRSMQEKYKGVSKFDLAKFAVIEILKRSNLPQASLLLTGGSGMKSSITGPSILPAVNALNGAGGETRLWDSLSQIIESLAGETGGKLLVICSDGIDTASTLRMEKILTICRTSDLTIVSVATTKTEIAEGWGDAGLAEVEKGKKVLKKLAEETGGIFISPSSQQEIIKFAAELEGLLAPQYYITYQSTNRTTKGWRRIEVECTRRKVDKLLYKKGYFVG